MMTDDDVEIEGEEVWADICNAKSMDSSHATQQQSIDFLEGIIFEANTFIRLIRSEM